MSRQYEPGPAAAIVAVIIGGAAAILAGALFIGGYGNAFLVFINGGKW